MINELPGLGYFQGKSASEAQATSPGSHKFQIDSKI